jgi:hypothetical protein
MSRNRRGFLCTSALSTLVSELASETKADFVFFDAGPNIGPLNRVILLDCSHFIVPVACDLFSKRALKTLGFALSEWVSTWERVREMAPDGTDLLSGSPLLLGYIPQGFRVYNGMMAKSSFAALSTLESRIVEFVLKPLQAAYRSPPKEKPLKLRLGQVKFFGTLVTDAQNQGRAIWEVSGGSAVSKQEAKLALGEIARHLVALTA